MDFGFQSSLPYAGWIQTHNGTTDGVGDDLLLQPVTGNVGIGTTSANKKLDFGTGTTLEPGGGDIRLAGMSDWGFTANQTDRYIGRWNSTHGWTSAIKFGHELKDTYGMGMQDMYERITFSVGFNYATVRELMTIHGEGGVGIGTTSPYGKLHVTNGTEGDVWTSTTRARDCHILVGGNEWGTTGENESVKIGLGYFDRADANIPTYICLLYTSPSPRD